MATPNNSQARRTAEKILAALESGPKTIEQICKSARVSDNTAYRHVGLLMQAPRLVHVCGYVRDADNTGPNRKVFALGNKPNVKFVPLPRTIKKKQAAFKAPKEERPDPMPVTIRAPGIVIHRIAG